MRYDNKKFREIPNYNDYWISKCGKIISTKYGYPRYLCQNISNNGYLVVTLCKNNSPKKLTVHSLVLKTYKPKSINQCGNHKDGNKLNNHISNLEWVTYKRSTQHAYENDLIKLPKGEDAKASILTNSQVKKILWELVLGEKTQGDLSLEYEVSRGCIGCIKQGKSWKSVHI